MDPWPGEAGVRGGSGQSLLQECGTSPEVQRDLPVILQREWPDRSPGSGRPVPSSQACPSNGRAGPGGWGGHRLSTECQGLAQKWTVTVWTPLAPHSQKAPLFCRSQHHLNAGSRPVAEQPWLDAFGVISGLSVGPPGLQMRKLRHCTEWGELGFASRSFLPGLGTCETFPQPHICTAV